MTRPTRKPGFLLIEIMVCILLLVVSASIVGIYAGFSQKRLKNGGQRLKALSVALKALDCMEEGFIDSHEGYLSLNQQQRPLWIEWDDGKVDQVWLGQVTIGWQEKNLVTLSTILPQKAV